MRPARSRLSWLVMPASIALGTSCYDPVHADAVEALGPEPTPGVEYPNHRPGQPCTTCHGDEGPAKNAFAIAGTIYETRQTTPEPPAPAPGVTVRITDATNTTRTVTTNDAGNFWIYAKDWKPSFSLRVQIEADGVEAKMASAIGRDGSCATCHRGTGNATNMPGVYLRKR